MEKNVNQHTLENRLQSEKINVSPLSVAYKDQLTQKIWEAAKHSKPERKVIFSLPLKYVTLAALLILSLGFFFINQPKVETPTVTAPVAKINPKPEDLKSLILLAEKFNPDQIGVYASYVLTAETTLNDKYQSEFRAFGAISNHIVNSFYDDFRPANNKKDN